MLDFFLCLFPRHVVIPPPPPPCRVFWKLRSRHLARGIAPLPACARVLDPAQSFLFLVAGHSLPLSSLAHPRSVFAFYAKSPGIVFVPPNRRLARPTVASAPVAVTRGLLMWRRRRSRHALHTAVSTFLRCGASHFSSYLPGAAHYRLAWCFYLVPVTAGSLCSPNSLRGLAGRVDLSVTSGLYAAVCCVDNQLWLLMKPL